MIPSIQSVTFSKGSTAGGDLVRLFGRGFAPRLGVTFGGASALVVNGYKQANVSVATARTPPHPEGLVDVTLQNLDEGGHPIEGESAVLPQGFLYRRPRVVEESDLTRLTRHLLQTLKAQVLQDTVLATSVDYRDGEARLTPLARVPALVLSGPILKPNAFYTRRAPDEGVVAGVAGPEILWSRPSRTVDLHFTLTAVSERTVELLNLMPIVARFFDRNLWIELPTDPNQPNPPTIRWEMDPEGDYRSDLRSQGGLYTFSIGLLIRGFDLHEGHPLEFTQIIAATELKTEPQKEPSS